MGRATLEIRVLMSVSRHNSEQDRLDDRAAERLHQDIEALIRNEPNYERIVLWTEGPSER